MGQGTHIEYINPKDFFVTGDPVIILLYLAYLPRLIIFLVLLAVGVLIVVDSSMAIKVLCEFKNLDANLNTFFCRQSFNIHN